MGGGVKYNTEFTVWEIIGQMHKQDKVMCYENHSVDFRKFFKNGMNLSTIVIDLRVLLFIHPT